MKKFFIVAMLFPLLGIGQAKTILSSFRVFPKTDKIALFEKALAAHAQKYHSGDWKWRVWTVSSGPDYGAYMISEGPSDWATMDGRGDINTAHQDDWNNNVHPLITNRGTSVYASFEADLSTVQLTDYSDKIIINHITAKPGKPGAVRELMVKMKKVWSEGNESVAVYSEVASGDPGFLTVTRLKNGLKELATGYRKPINERFNAAHGGGSWDSYLKDYADAVERRWSELLEYKPTLSSK